MADTRIVGVKDLKNNLSAYLREVRRGTRILVSDRDRVVAELHEPEAVYGLPDSKDPNLAELIRSGSVAPPVREKTALPPPPVRLAEGLALRLLEEDRAGSQR